MEILNKNHELSLDRHHPIVHYDLVINLTPTSEVIKYIPYPPPPCSLYFHPRPLPQCSQIQYLEYCLDHAYIYPCINIHYRIHVTVKALEHFCKEGGGDSYWKLWWDFCLSYLYKLLPLTSKCIHIYCYLRQVSVGPSHIIFELVETTTPNHNYI